MKSNFNLLYLVITFIATSVFAQEDKPETVFITLGEKPKEEIKEEKRSSETLFTATTNKPKKKKAKFAFFSQGSLSGYYSPITGDENKEKRNDNFNNDDEPICEICDEIRDLDGIGIHYGYGIFFKSFIGISANAGIDFVWNHKLVSMPVYGTLTLSPFPKSEFKPLLQASLGHAFALGKGDLSGTYQKYRIGGLASSGIQFFAEVNLYNFPIHGLEKWASVGIGIYGIGLLD